MTNNNNLEFCLSTKLTFPPPNAYEVNHYPNILLFIINYYY